MVEHGIVTSLQRLVSVGTLERVVRVGDIAQIFHSGQVVEIKLGGIRQEKLVARRVPDVAGLLQRRAQPPSLAGVFMDTGEGRLDASDREGQTCRSQVVAGNQS